MLRRYPVFTFYLVVFALALMGLWLAFFVFHGSLWVQWIAAGTPALASVFLTALLDGKAGVSELLSRLLRWRVRWKWYAAILLLPVVYVLAWVFFNTLVDGQTLSAAWGNLLRLAQALLRAGPTLLLTSVLFAALIAGEELGWRGFALERLLKTRSPFLASVIVGFFWGIWHLPAALDPTNVLNKAPLPYSLSLFTLGTIVFSFVYTWLWQNTRGSLLIACLFHGFYDLLNTITATIFPSFYLRFWLYLLVMAALLLPVWGPALARAGQKRAAEQAPV